MTFDSLAELAMWAAAVVAAGWKLTQLVRHPSDRSLRAVAGCTILVAIALTAQLAAGSADTALFAQTPKLIQNVTLTAFFALLLSVLRSIVSTVDDRVGPSPARGYAEPGLAVVTALGLVAAFAASSSAERGAEYGASDDAGVLSFYLIGNLYMAYATASGARLAWRAAGHGRARIVRFGLRCAGVGLLVCLFGTHIPRILDTAGRLVIGRSVPGTAVWTPPALAVGIIVFFAGIGLPGARTAVLKLRLRLRQRREYGELHTLWRLLHARFPAIALLPEPGSVAARWTRLAGPTPLRYYRRVVECRDGLVQLSVYLPAPILGSTRSAEQAELVRQALHRSRECTPDSAAPPVSVFAASATDQTAAADTGELLRLARALATHKID